MLVSCLYTEQSSQPNPDTQCITSQHVLKIGDRSFIGDLKPDSFKQELVSSYGDFA